MFETKLEYNENFSIGLNDKAYNIGRLKCAPKKKELFFFFEYSEEARVIQFESDSDDGILRPLVDHISFHRDGTVHFKHRDPIKLANDSPNTMIGKKRCKQIIIKGNNKNLLEIPQFRILPLLVISIEGNHLVPSSLFKESPASFDWINKSGNNQGSIVFWGINDYRITSNKGPLIVAENFSALGLDYPQYRPYVIPSAFENSLVMAGTGAGTSIITTFMPQTHKGHQNSIENKNYEENDLPMYFEAAPRWKWIMNSYSSLSKEKREEVIKIAETYNPKP